MDIGFDGNQVVDTVALEQFAAGGLSYWVKAYDQAPSGAVDYVQPTTSLAPYATDASGKTIRTAAGVPAMRGALEGRYMVAAGAFTPIAGSDFSVSTLAESAVAHLAAVTNAFETAIGISSAAGNTLNAFNLRFGSRSSATARTIVAEMTSVSAGSTEISGWVDPVAALTSCILSANCQAAALSGGPGVGTTLYVNRAKIANGTNSGTSDNASHSPAALTSCTDIRLFANGQGAWSTNSVNGADMKITYAYIGLAMTDADRVSLEGQIYDKFAAVLLAAKGAAPKLGANGEAFDFSSFASFGVTGTNGKANLLFASSGSSLAVSAAPSGISGLKQTGTATPANEFKGSNTFGWDQRTFTSWVIFTPNNFEGASLLPGLFGHGNSILGVNTNKSISWGFDKDHADLTGTVLDNSTNPANPNSDYTNMMIGTGDPNTGAPVYAPYFYGGGFLQLNNPAHDNSGDHPPFYTKKKFLGHGESVDGQRFPVRNSVMVMKLMRHRPHPNYDFSKAYNDPANVLWRNKADVEVFAAIVGGLDGFKKVPGGYTDMRGRSSTAIGNNQQTFVQGGSEYGLLGTFDGWLHAAGMHGGKYMTDTEIQSLFLAVSGNPANVANLV
jgi:hypothetical protein